MDIISLHLGLLYLDNLAQFAGNSVQSTVYNVRLIPEVIFLCYCVWNCFKNSVSAY